MDPNKNKVKDTEEEINEAGASFGDPSSTPEPATPKGGMKHNRSSDKEGGEKAPIMQGSSRLTKAGMIGDMVRSMQSMSASDVKTAYKAFSSAKGEMEPVMQGNSTVKENFKITTADVDVSDDVNIIFGEEDLTEDFKTKATDVFETAVVTKVNEITEGLVAMHEAEMAEIKEDLETKLNDYLNYVVEEWMSENEVAIETGLRNELAEDFISGLKNLFVEHYIEVPEDKVDVLEELANENDQLKEQLDAEMNRNIELVNENDSFRKEAVIVEMADDLAMVDREKFYELAESVDFEDEENFRSRLDTIKDKYFGKIEEEVVSNDPDTSDDSPVELNEDTHKVSNSDPTVKAMADSISRFLR